MKRHIWAASFMAACRGRKWETHEACCRLGKDGPESEGRSRPYMTSHVSRSKIQQKTSEKALDRLRC